MKQWAWVLLGVLLLMGVSTAQVMDSTATGEIGEYVIGVGDRIRISYYQGITFDDPGKVVETTVGEEGQVLIPLLGKIPVINRTPNEIQNEIRNKLTRFIENPQVFVEVLDYQSVTALLIGATNVQGIFPLLPNMTATQFIAAHGGVREISNLEKVTVLRSNGEMILLDLKSFFENGAVSQDVLLQPGDRVFIPWKEPSWLERATRIIQVVSLVLQTVILIVVLGG